jgi:uncharacterized protein with predicted RNA binding PUA domain
MSQNEFKKVRTIADYQFGKGCGETLFPLGSDFKFILSRTGKIRQILENGERTATLRASDGLLTLSIEGARRLHSHLPFPRLRAVVNEDAAHFIRDGRNVFARHVVNVDPEIRASEEVIVVDERDNLLATGRTLLCAEEMLAFCRGVAVEVRRGVK